MLLGLWLTPPAPAQDTLAGTINQYARVLEIDTCAASLRLDDASAFQPGDTLLLIQMQGASIDLSNNGDFGQVTDLQSAGRYERIVAGQINGDTILATQQLLHDYQTEGRIQLVSLPYYESAVVTETLTAPAWNGNTGGLLALRARRLEMQADIDLSGRGFRGGDAALDYDGNCVWFGAYDNFSYESGSIRGGNKGEGIAGIGPAWSRGRGAAANGGGGGNDHNSGGGGGAQLSSGGLGGINDNPSFFGCQGDNPGRGGRALPPVPERLFLGGGGGAGHGNNNVATPGGQGGGIALILADTLQANGFAIRANGTAPLQPAAGDGAGGGGAGGTLFLRSNSPAPELTLEARGGRGGDADNGNQEQCFGPGGGGSGGRLLRQGLEQATVLLSGGEAGRSLNSASCPESSNGAAAGEPGLENSLPELPLSDEPLPEMPSLDLPVDSLFSCGEDPITLSATSTGSSAALQWQADIGDGSGFLDLPEGGNFTGTNTATLSINNPSFASGYTFRLRSRSGCFGDVFSPTAVLSTGTPPSADFAFTINGLEVQFDNLSQADAFIWDFGDSNTSTETAPVHTYAQGGDYIVSLRAVSIECNDTVSITQTINLQTAPQASATANVNSGCAPLQVQFNSNSPEAESYEWSFEGGTPDFSNQPNPAVTYANPGVYNVSLRVSNAVGADTAEYADFITVLGSPAADFQLTTNGFTVELDGTSSSADSYLWDFGDGNSSNGPTTSHTYSTPGLYTITLTASNQCGSSTATQEVAIGSAPTPSFTIPGGSTGCAPISLDFANATSGTYDSLLWAFPGGNPASSTAENPTITYPQPGTYSISLTVFSPFGTFEAAQNDAVTILQRPQAAFTYEIDGLSVTFNNLSTEVDFYNWNFGDGNTSTQTNPVHTYTAPGFYEVTLNASNGICGRSTVEGLSLEPSQSQETHAATQLRLFPNPTTGQVCLLDQAQAFPRGHWQLLRSDGQLLSSGSLRANICWDWSTLPPALYGLRLQYKGHTAFLRFLIQR